MRARLVSWGGTSRPFTRDSRRLPGAGRRGIAAAPTNVFETPSHWFLESERLRDAGRLSEEDARRLRWLDAFGALIGNTDRHQYNILFFAEGSRLRLAPAFDQIPMLYAPTADGQLPPRVFAAPNMTADTLDVWDDARRAAQRFWALGSDDARVSDEMRLLCAGNARLLAQ
ncbi:MAG: HipA domain-containing protein [Vicinamibacterales bacterium]